MIRVLVIDDHSIVRKGVRSLLAEATDIQVVGEAEDGEKGMQEALRLRPDVVVLDVALPGQGGLEVLTQLRGELPDSAVLMLSMHAEDRYALPLLRSGAAGYVPKRGPAEVLIAAIRKVAAGGKFLSAEMAERLAYGMEVSLEGPVHERLSGRELEVLLSLARGMSLTAIGEELGISVKTVSTYRRRLLEKMEMKSTADLLRYAYDHKLVD